MRRSSVANVLEPQPPADVALGEVVDGDCVAGATALAAVDGRYAAAAVPPVVDVVWEPVPGEATGAFAAAIVVAVTSEPLVEDGLRKVVALGERRFANAELRLPAVAPETNPTDPGGAITIPIPAASFSMR
jgi:hypothetical protein